MNNTNQKLIDGIKEELFKLPKESQEVINSFDWIKLVSDIGGKYNLTEDEINNLQLETALALVGLTDPDYFAQTIEDEVVVTKNESEIIAKEITEKVFKPIAEKIESNLQNKVKDKNTSWDQNVNFTLSGGDYSVFAEKAGTTNTVTDIPKVTTSVFTAKTDASAKKVEDIRSKFTI